MVKTDSKQYGYIILACTKYLFYLCIEQMFVSLKATIGTCTVPKPGMLDFVAKAKWEAWSQLTGMETVN